jgi:hypothetical protein
VLSLTGEEAWSTYTLEDDGPILVLVEDGDLKEHCKQVFGNDSEEVFSIMPEFCNRKIILLLRFEKLLLIFEYK